MEESFNSSRPSVMPSVVTLNGSQQFRVDTVNTAAGDMIISFTPDSLMEAANSNNAPAQLSGVPRKVSNTAEVTGGDNNAVESNVMDEATTGYSSPLVTLLKSNPMAAKNQLQKGQDTTNVSTCSITTMPSSTALPAEPPLSMMTSTALHKSTPLSVLPPSVSFTSTPVSVLPPVLPTSKLIHSTPSVLPHMSMPTSLPKPVLPPTVLPTTTPSSALPHMSLATLSTPSPVETSVPVLQPNNTIVTIDDLGDDDDAILQPLFTIPLTLQQSTSAIDQSTSNAISYEDVFQSGPDVIEIIPDTTDETVFGNVTGASSAISITGNDQSPAFSSNSASSSNHGDSQSEALTPVLTKPRSPSSVTSGNDFKDSLINRSIPTVPLDTTIRNILLSSRSCIQPQSPPVVNNLPCNHNISPAAPSTVSQLANEQRALPEGHPPNRQWVSDPVNCIQPHTPSVVNNLPCSNDIISVTPSTVKQLTNDKGDLLESDPTDMRTVKYVFNFIQPHTPSEVNHHPCSNNVSPGAPLTVRLLTNGQRIIPKAMPPKRPGVKDAINFIRKLRKPNEAQVGGNGTDTSRGTNKCLSTDCNSNNIIQIQPSCDFFTEENDCIVVDECPDNNSGNQEEPMKSLPLGIGNDNIPDNFIHDEDKTALGKSQALKRRGPFSAYFGDDVDPDDVRIQCCLCTHPQKETFTSVQLYLAHTREFHNNKYVCHECATCFTSHGSLLRHRPKHTGIRQFACTICRKTFYRRDKCKNHIVKHHLDKL